MIEVGDFGAKGEGGVDGMGAGQHACLFRAQNVLVIIVCGLQVQQGRKAPRPLQPPSHHPGNSRLSRA